jgi:hypothetical protein
MGTRFTCPSTTTDEFDIHYLADHDQRVLQALITAGAMVALADGKVDASERDEPRRAGLERSDFVRWPTTSLTAMQQYVRSWGHG